MTHFVDASFVYGSRAKASKDLRTGTGGLLRSQIIGAAQYPPELAPKRRHCPLSKSCFDAGWYKFTYLFTYPIWYIGSTTTSRHTEYLSLASSTSSPIFAHLYGSALFTFFLVSLWYLFLLEGFNKLFWDFPLHFFLRMCPL